MYFKLKLGEWDLRITPLEADEPKYPACDDKKNVLKWIAGKLQKGYFINEKTGQRFDKACKLVNGKVVTEFKSRMLEQKKYFEVADAEADDLIVKHTYLVEPSEIADKLYSYLSKNKKSLKFGYNAGKGWKGFRTYMFCSRLFKGCLEMTCGNGQKSQLIKAKIADAETEKAAKEALKNINLNISNVNSVAVEDLIAL